jgi:hypothetical protein
MARRFLRAANPSSPPREHVSHQLQIICTNLLVAAVHFVRGGEREINQSSLMKTRNMGGVGYHFRIADGDVPTNTELTRYQRDSQHADEQRKAFRLRLIRASSRYSLSRIFGRLVLPNSTVSLLALTGTALFASHTVYA